MEQGAHSFLDFQYIASWVCCQDVAAALNLSLGHGLSLMVVA